VLNAGTSATKHRSANWVPMRTAFDGGIFRIAYKLLIIDQYALLVGITFAVFLTIEMISLFAGF
jgi:hypothetical protein